jgi:hypothetical protein
VNCEVCGTELPQGAMFCGECGRAVAPRAAQAVHPDSGMPLESSGGRAAMSGGRDTVILEPLTRAIPEFESADAVASSHIDAGLEQDLPPEVEAQELAEAKAESKRNSSTASARHDASAASSPAPSPAAPRPDPFPWGDRGSAIFIDSDEIEQTLIVPKRDTGQRFVLQFSTGESITVYGSGLLGRNPVPQPSEYFDQLVSISDPGKSVSKTHIEFGQDSGSFWVSDRFSGNGSVVREPESSPRRLVPGKRYRIVRGTRVDIGEQFFVVS